MLSRFLIFAFVFTMAVSSFAQNNLIEPGVPQTLAKWRAANYSDVRYKLNLTLEKMSPVLKGTIEVSLKNNADQIILDWRKIRGKENLSKVSNVSINGTALTLQNQITKEKPFLYYDDYYEEINEHLVFKEGVIKGENVIKLDFTSPIATSGAAVTRYVDKEDGAEYIYSLFVPSDASTAFPVFDQPDLKVRFQLSVVAPGNWKVVSNTDADVQFDVMDGSGLRGKPQNLSEPIFNSISFKETKPISTYVFAFAAGEFETFRKIDEKVSISADKIRDSEVRELPFSNARREYSYIYVRKSQAEKFKQHADEVFRLNREAVKYLESYFDYKFPFPKYDLVLIPEFPFGGMEHAGATFLREDRVIFPTEPTKNDYIT
ncbi:MAG TPA: M1 family aminopeptidase, partial [Pyrinomonadaceae bacterium]|nr:M1 family aminopeptidase [Pyrinomonadaceae bacterium]